MNGVENKRKDCVMEKSFEREVIERLVKIETKLDEQDFKGLSKQLEEADNRSINNEKRIDKIEDTMKWLWRTIAGLLIAGVVGSVILFK